MIDFDADCARVFGQLRADLIRRGAAVPPIDLLVGSVAVAYDMTLVTHNTAHFLPTPGLRLVDWLVP